MDRARYLELRSQFDFKIKSSMLFQQLLLNAALVGGVVGLWSQSSALKYFCIPLLVVLMFRGFALMHEASHRAAAENKTLNDWVGILNGCLCFLPYEGWKKSHLQHHLWTGNVDKDPVMAFLHIHPRMSPRGQKILSAFWMMWFPILGLIQNIVFWGLSLKTYFDEKRSFKYFMSLAMPLSFLAAIVSFAPASFILTALAPAAVLYLVAVEIVNLPHHLQLPQDGGEAKYPVWQQYQFARSCIYPKQFARFFALNFNYHTEHHMFPDAPWYCLEEIHQVIQGELKASYNSDPYLKWFVENKKKTVGAVLAKAPVRAGKEAPKAS